MATKLENVNIISEQLLPTPAQVKAKVALSKKAADTVVNGRKEVKDIIHGRSDKLLIVVGPCSIHDVSAAEEFAHRLHSLQKRVEENFLLVMRLYFEKPRTVTGWKGLINDPFLDDSFQIKEGLYIARRLLLNIAEIGVPVGTEALDPISPQYLADLVSWFAIGARTTESQTHRELASGLSAAVGFKNGTDGSIEVALNAMRSAISPHHFLGINQESQCTVFQTRGNGSTHIILRGGTKGPNYEKESIAACVEDLKKNSLNSRIMIDCSHGNSGKDFRKQPAVFRYCINQLHEDKSHIFGFMLESNIFEGNQQLLSDPKKLLYGVSITDACIGWDTTEDLILEASLSLQKIKKDKRVKRSAP